MRAARRLPPEPNPARVRAVPPRRRLLGWWWHWRRHPAVRWSAVAMLAIGCGLAADHLGAVLDEPPPSASGPAVVATRDLAPGTRITPGDLRAAPAGAVTPTGAELVTDPAAAIGRVVTDRVLAGEVVVASRLAPAGLTGVAALLPKDHAALAVPVDDRAPAMEVGQTVDVWATPPWDDTAFAPVSGLDAERVATGAAVLEIGEATVTLAVADVDVPTTTGAVLAGSVVLVVRGPT